ncbi:50S ribosome-binding GTPase [Gracilaria domingensis]|nr:50S ribosome-binding GTPase [Gracilaria domingensis]
MQASNEAFRSSAHQKKVPDQELDDIFSAFDKVVDRIEQDIDSKSRSSPLKRKGQQKDHDDHLRRLESLVSLPSELFVEAVKDTCSGCGTVLQSESPDLSGFLPPEVLAKQRIQEGIPVAKVESTSEGEGILVEDAPKRVVCQRCYRLTHYGAIEPALRVPPSVAAKSENFSSELSPEKFRRNLEALKKINSVIIYLVDIFDFHGTFITALRDIVGTKNPILLAVNKVDLLPADMKPSRVETWIKQECAELGLSDITRVHLISSTKGQNVRILLADAVRLAKKRKADIYVIGAANVGKSTFINQLINMQNRNKAKLRGKKQRSAPTTVDALTTSVVPGTTLDVIKIPLGSSINLYDTPGLMMPHQLTNYLDSKDLRAVLPSKTVERVSLRLGEGKALYIGALARIEVVSGRPFFFTSFFSPEVKVHPGKTEDALEFTKKHAGALLKPPSSLEAFERLGEWTSKSFTATGEGWKRSCADIVLSGLGWVALTGAGDITVRICVPRGVGVFTRESLMPFETQKGVSSYTGATAVNKKQLRKKRRSY